MYIQQNGWWLIFLHQITQQFRAPSQATNTRKGHLTLHHLLHLSSHQISHFFLLVLTFFLGRKQYETIWNHHFCWWSQPMFNLLTSFAGESHDIVTYRHHQRMPWPSRPWRLVELASGIAPLGACEICVWGLWGYTGNIINIPTTYGLVWVLYGTVPPF